MATLLPFRSGPLGSGGWKDRLIMTPEQQQHAVRPAAPSINGWSAEYLEAQYRQFKDDPNSVSADTRAFFQGFELGSSGPGGPGVGSLATVRPSRPGPTT